MAPAMQAGADWVRTARVFLIDGYQPPFAPELEFEAEALAKTLQSLGILRIYSSPLRRALETSQIIGNVLNIPVEIEENLTEMKLGPWQGLAEAEVEKRFRSDYQLWNTRPGDLVLDDREPLLEVQGRALKAIHKIKEKNVESPTLAVTHVALIRCLIIQFQGLDIDLYRTIDVPNISVFRLQLERDRGHISRFQ